jgi:hypothetical protein
LGAAVLAGLDRDLDRLRAPAALSPAQADRCRQAADAARETDYRAALEAVLRPVRDASRGIPLASDSSSSI